MRRAIDIRFAVVGLLLASPLLAEPGPAASFRARETSPGQKAPRRALDPGLAQAVVVATNSARLKNQAEVSSGDVVVNSAAAGDTLQSGDELDLDPRAVTSAGSDLKANRLRVKNNAVVGGDVFYNSLSNQGTILGARVTPLSLPVFASLPPFHRESPFPDGLDVTVAAGGYALLPDGDYGAVHVGASGTLIFEGGTYNLRSLTGDNGAQLLFAAPAEVRVEERLSTGSGAVLGPEPGSGVSPHDLVIYVAGSNGGTGGLLSTPLAAEIGNGNHLTLSFYVPNGTLRLGHATIATGAFLARDVDVETQARLGLDSYFFNRPPIAQGDAASVVEGGTVSVLDSGALSVLANDSDPDGDPLTVNTTPVSGPAHGSLTLNADGTFSYTHDGSETTSDSFVYEVCDDGSPAECATATVTIAIARPIRVEVSVFGLGSGRVVSIPAGIDCDSTCFAFFDGTQSIQLVAEPFGTSVFGGFSGDIDCADGQLTPDGDKVCLVRFNLSAVPATLSVSFSGTGSGRVVSTPAGIDCPGACSAGFPIPTRVELTAQADSGSVFVGWSGDPGCESGEVPLFADTQCVATFDLIPPPPLSYTLTLVFVGGGEGTITSNPAGVLCDSGCTVSFPANTALVLFARPVAGTFGGWGRDCAGSGFSTSLLLDGNKTCTVEFDP